MAIMSAHERAAQIWAVLALATNGPVLAWCTRQIREGASENPMGIV